MRSKNFSGSSEASIDVSDAIRDADRLERMAETQPATALHFTEDQPQPGFADIRSDNVDLPKPAAPIPLQHPHALPLQLCTGKVSPRTPNCFFGAVAGIAHLGSEACVRRSESCGLTKICGNHPVMTCENYRGIGPQSAPRSPCGPGVGGRHRALVSGISGPLGVAAPGGPLVVSGVDLGLVRG